MDYQGNYFPEEHDENESKVYRTVKGFFKWTMYGISFVIYAIIIFLMISNSESNILENNYMLGDINTTDDIQLYRINTKLFMNDDGSMQVYNVDYSEEYSMIEIGVKFNAKKHTDNDRGDCLDYVLSDSNGKSYKLTNIVSDSGGRYGYSRICFSGISIDLDSNDLRYNTALDAAFAPAFPSEEQNFSRSDVCYTLSIYRKTDNKLLHEFRIYDNTVTFNKTDYNN